MGNGSDMGSKEVERPHYNKCGPIVKRRDWQKLPISELTRAERNMKFCISFLKIPEGKDAGKPIYFTQSLEDFFYAVFDNPHGTRRAILSMARKNAKSTGIACILLCFLVGPEAKLNTQIVSGAMSRDQASLIFKLAVKMIQMSERLQPLVKIIPSSKTLIGIAKNVEFKALAADGATAQGLSVYLGLIDECGQVRGPNSDFINAITSSQGAHEEPLIIFLSTQAATDADFLSLMIDDSISSQDPHTVCHLYEAPKECDLMDRKAWEMANPGLGLFRSETDLEEQMKQAARMPSMESSARNLLLNQRISVISPFISKSVWESNGGDAESLAGLTCYAGLDLSSRTDLTAFVIFGRDTNGMAHVHTFAWTPQEGLLDRAKRDRVPYDVWVKQGHLRTTPGHTVDYDYVAQEIGEIVADLDVAAISFDRWRIDVFKKSCERAGIDLPLMEYGQGFKDMSPAIDALEADLLNSRICHSKQPCLTMAAGNAIITRDPAGGRKLDKSKATGRIDPLVALAMAYGGENKKSPEPPPEYKIFFV